MTNTPLIKFPSIEQFRNVIRHVREQTAYAGKDENGEVIKDYGRKLPTLEFEGSVKLHGTNGAVVQNSTKRWVQSRERILTPDSDNMGFATFVYKNTETFDVMFNFLESNMYSTETDTVAIYGEWCGSSIQKSVAITSLPKMFVLFGIKIRHDDETDTWLSAAVVNAVVDNMYEDSSVCSIYSIYNFPTFKMTIDFNYPEDAQNKLIDLTIAVETECPVGKSFGASGVGEGIVWRCTTKEWNDSGTWFKVKGEKHSASKVKILAAVDVEKVNSIRECVDMMVTEARLEQGISVMKENGLEVDIKNMGAYLKWLAGDCFKEELDTIVESGLEPKEVGKSISTKGRIWFIDRLNKEAFNHE